MQILSEHACFGGTQRFLAHDSRECATGMRFAVYEPPQAKHGRVPVLYYLAGLTCTEETFMIKARASRGCPATTRAGISVSVRGFTSTRPRRRGRRTTACTPG